MSQAFEPVKDRPKTLDPQQWAEWNIDIARQLTRRRADEPTLRAALQSDPDESAVLVPEQALKNLRRRINRVIGRLQSATDADSAESAVQLIRALALFDVES